MSIFETLVGIRVITQDMAVSVGSAAVAAGIAAFQVDLPVAGQCSRRIPFDFGKLCLQKPVVAGVAEFPGIALKQYDVFTFQTGAFQSLDHFHDHRVTGNRTYLSWLASASNGVDLYADAIAFLEQAAPGLCRVGRAGQLRHSAFDHLAHPLAIHLRIADRQGVVHFHHLAWIAAGKGKSRLGIFNAGSDKLLPDVLVVPERSAVHLESAPSRQASGDKARPGAQEKSTPAQSTALGSGHSSPRF